MSFKKCPQTKCDFNIMGGCRKCMICGCPPNEINDNCDKCWNCAYDEGVLRWEDEKDEVEKAENKPIKEEKIKLAPYCN